MQNTKGKFALKMEDGAEVRNIDDLKAHFDIGSVVRDFSNGKLLTWLEDRYYDEEADAIRKISTNEGNLEQKLCAIFGIESEWIIERRNRLKKYTNDANILANADKVAFDQEDLADLLDAGAREIYLCANRFVIPLRMKNKTYIGVKDAVAVIRSKNLVNFDELGIKFQNIAFDDDYRKILDDYQKILDAPTVKVEPAPAKVNLPLRKEIKKLYNQYKMSLGEVNNFLYDIFPNPDEFPFLKINLASLFESLYEYRLSNKSTEKKKAANALVKVSDDLQKAISKAKWQGWNEVAGILEAHRIMVEDPAMSTAIDEQIDISGSAPKAVIDAYEENAKIFETMEDEYFRSRAVDMRAVGTYIVYQILDNSDAYIKSSNVQFKY